MMHRLTQRTFRVLALSLAALPGICPAAEPDPKPSYSGIYPHLAMFNDEGECGTGAVVPWAGKLWAITYGPHKPNGSSDKLYEISDDLVQTIRPESVGGTPANRLIHKETNQLLIGPYVIDAQRNVRVITPKQMPGRLTATARHLADPAGKVYYATMEEGFYEVDLKSLAVKELYKDANSTKNHGGDLLPGYHGKGAYSGQGRLIYANNGELSPEAQKNPNIASGVLAEWDQKDWKIVRRNQFTDVTGPGGIYGNEHPETDPIWSIGWDSKSLILMLRENGAWKSFRLPKGTHTYDGAHGWNTEWPRIRDIGESDLLMTMHGTFWHFPKTFSTANTAGISPRSTYLKVIGDFAKWNDKLVFGCDDAAKSEFLNSRKAKGKQLPPGQSQSNLWFVDPAQLDHIGPVIGSGAVWLNDSVKGGEWSDPFLFTGYSKRGLHLVNRSESASSFEFEVDATGKGDWKPMPMAVSVQAGDAIWIEFAPEEKGEWIRVRSKTDLTGITALFVVANEDPRKAGEADAIFEGLAKSSDESPTGGLIRSRGEGLKALGLAATQFAGVSSTDVGYYELDSTMKLKKVDDAKAYDYLKKNEAIPQNILKVEASSILYVDEARRRFRLPRGDAKMGELTQASQYRLSREIVTERDAFNCDGTFYELPAENAGGFGKIRPISTHNRRVQDYCSYRGLMVLTGIAGGENNPHILRSDDGKAAVWVGAIDDLWKLGKPVGVGGPWKDSAVKAKEPSDPYLMNGYGKKTLTLSHTSPGTVSFQIEVDINGEGLWVPYQTLKVAAGQKADHPFPAAFQAKWVRFIAEKDCTATAELRYE